MQHLLQGDAFLHNQEFTVVGKKVKIFTKLYKKAREGAGGLNVPKLHME
jgi:hypothetical protein